MDQVSDVHERESLHHKGGIGSFLRGVFRPNRNGDSALRETLEELLDESGASEDDFSEDEAVVISNILRLRKVTVEDVMVPRAEIVSVNINTPVPEVLALFATSGHSRLPVYKDTLDTPLGMVHIKDMLSPDEGGLTTSLEKAVRELLYISPSARIFDLIREMRLKRIHLALVVDEYGGIDGLVTIEDLIEQIVGDIVDEHDHEKAPEMIRREDGSVDVDGRMELEDFEKHFGPLFTEDERNDIDTLGGLVFRLAGRVPARGEVIRREGGPNFEILDANPRTIRRVRVTGLPEGLEE
ncbi:hemolysin family protein [Phaeovibrio sulfidiphilus]|uniref:hemolysin family protein n=1 Tax=Phaeovibrio sulfidiphilus TaxID=1220600 RepID=UPI0030844173